jgi:hypothetical protein
VVVYGADGEPFGTVTSSEGDYIAVDAGGDPPTFYVPASAIFEAREDGLYLSVTSADARRQGWDETPPAETVSQAGSRVEPATDYTAVQGEDSLADDPMSTPGDDGARTGERRQAGDGELKRPSGETGPA